MDSTRKRKLHSSATPNGTSEGSASKKIKLLNSNPAPSASGANNTAPSVQQIGQKLIEQLSRATDKFGRSITDAFQELPPEDDLPDYYLVTKMPISIEMIEDKVNKNGYPTLTTLESDFKRMVQNAKDYNEPKSEIFEDAERIRKAVYNFMKIHNPAYNDPNYTSFPTPISTTKLTLTNGAARTKEVTTEQDSEPVKHEPPSRDASAKPRLSLARKASEPKASEPPSERKSSVAPSATTGGEVGEEDEDMDFTGKSFQDAQQMIIAEAIRYTDDEGLEIFTPFVNLPSRKLEDYYKVIRHPVSLKSVQKRTRGIHGRDPPTGVTDFKSWHAFEDQVSFIWKNARTYNEDGSAMWNVANEFEQYFKSRLAEAKEKVEEPASTRLKLGGPKPPPASHPPVTLNLSHHRDSPTPGVSVDNEALLRQKQMVQAGANGHRTDQRPSPAINGSTPRPASQGTSGDTVRVASSVVPSLIGVKNEMTSTPAPPVGAAVPPISNGMMPPPLGRPPSGSPFPGQHGLPQSNSYHFTAPSALPPTALRSYPAAEALLPVVTISTHPQLRTIPSPYSLAITPHAALSQYSMTVTLPSTHFFLQIAPTISRDLSMGRAYRMFVSVNGGRLTQRDTQFHADTGKRTHLYEGTLAPGVNRIDVEVGAARTGENSEGKGLDLEKVTVFANLLRA